MSRNYDSEPDDEYDINSIDQIEFLYQLRHYSNIFGMDEIAKKIKIKKERLEKLYYSNIHGSAEITDIIKLQEDKFLEKIKEFENEKIKKEQLIFEAELKNEMLYEDLMDKRKNFAKIGTNKAKRRLNKLSNDNVIAKALRIALEIEDKNILAKSCYGEYRDRIYNLKYKLILDLVDIFKEQNWNYGIEKSSNYSTSHVIYFEIPGCEQISWHFSPNKNLDLQKYNGEWDQKVLSTLDKLEKTIAIILKDNNLI